MSAAAAAAISLPPRAARVSLYRDLLRTASRFHDYNFRMYAQRQVKEKFRQHRSESDATKLKAFFERAHKDLKMLHRQTLINRLYSSGDSIMEKAYPHESCLTSAFHVHAAPAPGEAFRAWLASAAVDSSEPLPADAPIPPEDAAGQKEPGQSTRLQADNKGQHTTPANLEGYSS